MNEFQLKCIVTEDLQKLYNSIKEELKIRKKRTNVERRQLFIKSLDPTNYETFDSYAQAIEHRNSNLLSLPKIKDPYHCRERYFPFLINQDWSDIYNYDKKDLCGDFYVYAHVDPSQRIFVTNKEFGGNYGGTPFYIGKGCGNRAYDLKRNQGHGKKIREVLNNGFDKDDIVHIAFSGLSENKAYEIESKLIYFFGSMYENERGKNGILCNLDIPKIPEFRGEMEKMMFKKVFYNKKINEEQEQKEAA